MLRSPAPLQAIACRCRAFAPARYGRLPVIDLAFFFGRLLGSISAVLYCLTVQRPPPKPDLDRAPGDPGPFSVMGAAWRAKTGPRRRPRGPSSHNSVTRAPPPVTRIASRSEPLPRLRRPAVGLQVSVIVIQGIRGAEQVGPCSASHRQRPVSSESSLRVSCVALSLGRRRVRVGGMAARERPTRPLRRPGASSGDAAARVDSDAVRR